MLTTVAAVPVPLSDTVCGELAALSVTVKIPLRLPAALGEKVTETVQLAPPASALGLSGHEEVCAKSVKLVLMLVIRNAALWLLVRVTICDVLLVPKACPPYVNVPGLVDAASSPMPFKLTVGFTAALPATVRVLFRVPAAVGVKNTDAVHVLPAASVAGLSGQVVVVL